MEAEKVVKLLNQQSDEAYVVTGGEYNKPLELDNMQANEDGSAVLIFAMPEGSTTGADTFLGNKRIYFC